MSTNSPSEERQRIINNNRSIRTIKNELESLAEHGVISDGDYDSIMSYLPKEQPLNSVSTRTNMSINSQSSNTSEKTPSSVVDPCSGMKNLRLDNSTAPSPPAVLDPVTKKVEISRAVAHYPYREHGDCNFEVGDSISVYEYTNQDWWLGKNLRTGQEGVFPHNHVKVVHNPIHDNSVNEKANMYHSYFPPPYQQPVSHAAPPPESVNPYNSSVPPMQVAEQGTASKMGKGGEMGKKLGKKLGNAAIFGAGATIGGNIVNSIF